MQNLFQRLKPSVKRELKVSAEKYSTVNSSLIPLLKNTTFYDDLTISNVKSLMCFSNICTSQISPWDFKYGDAFFKPLKK